MMVILVTVTLILWGCKIHNHSVVVLYCFASLSALLEKY